MTTTDAPTKPAPARQPPEANGPEFDPAPLLKRLKTAIGGRDVRIAMAESCTGGMLASEIAGDDGVSDALDRGFVVYSVDAKCELLGLDRDMVEACDGVSAEVAIAMAKGALANSHADIAVAITGFAGPRKEDEEVGLVHLAAIDREGAVKHRELHLGEIGRKPVCSAAVATALAMLVEAAR